MQPKVIYSPDYDFHFYGIEKLHPFDGRKFSKAWKEIIQFSQGEQPWWICPTKPVSEEDLRRVHTEDYLESLKLPAYVVQALELPALAPIARIYPQFIEKHILRPMRLATQGTILAAEAALENQIGINLGGGYHHASRTRGEGFCIYSDVAIAIAKLRNDGKLEKNDKVLIIDLDVHQSNGLERIFYDDQAIYILDMYNQEIYPQDQWAQKRIDCAIKLPSGTSDQEYYNHLLHFLPQTLSDLKKLGQVKIAFYIAGTDIYRRDQLGHLKVSNEGIFNRDKYIFDLLTFEGIPWVMVLGGGYSKESYLLVAESVRYVLMNYGELSKLSTGSPAYQKHQHSVKEKTMSDKNSDDKEIGKKAKIGKKLDTAVKIGNIAEDGVEVTKGAVELGKKIAPKIGKKFGG